jgi:hypothetical protein
MDAATASRAPEWELEAVAAADAVEEGSAASQDDAMQAELENIAFETSMLFDLANRLTGRGSRRVKRVILAAADSIWDSAYRLYSEGDYDKGPGSAPARER